MSINLGEPTRHANGAAATGVVMIALGLFVALFVAIVLYAGAPNVSALGFVGAAAFVGLGITMVVGGNLSEQERQTDTELTAAGVR